ncbi:hypothetical protein G5I_03460 [Acromyrmex echinatior]|uniref:Uncharacterized protein n=1 Tax=Acromyrmex echinatior TaxID=103372 RepID=F4WD18_ACREC|nr:hypothetical protein G5I_03460 [Acromyrmex echinatior]
MARYDNVAIGSRAAQYGAGICQPRRRTYGGKTLETYTRSARGTPRHQGANGKSNGKNDRISVATDACSAAADARSGAANA